MSSPSATTQTNIVPVFPGKAKVVHVGFDDPPKLTAGLPDNEAKLAIYRRVRDQIRSVSHYDARESDTTPKEEK